MNSQANPLIWADIPNFDIIRVEDTYLQPRSLARHVDFDWFRLGESGDANE